MKLFLTAITLALLASFADISMLTIKIGSPESELKKIKLEEIAREDGIVKFRIEDGNDFSVTTENGKVVFMENDWMQNPKSSKTLLPWFKFGITSLKDIREKFGTNGFIHKNASYIQTDTHLIMFNCFALDSANNEVLVTITKISMDSKPTEETIAENLKLEALIIADSKYLDRIWGEEKTFDTNYKKVKL